MSDAQSEMLQRITRVETVVEGMDEKLDKALDITEMAVKAQESASSAHKRLDKIENNQTWLWRSFAAAVIAAIVAFIVGGGLKP